MKGEAETEMATTAEVRVVESRATGVRDLCAWDAAYEADGRGNAKGARTWSGRKARVSAGVALLVVAGVLLTYLCYTAAIARADADKEQLVVDQCAARTKTLVRALDALRQHTASFAGVIRAMQTGADGTLGTAPLSLTRVKGAVQSWIQKRDSSEVRVQEYRWVAETEAQMFAAVERAATRAYGAPRPLSAVNPGFFRPTTADPEPFLVPEAPSMFVYPVLLAKDVVGDDVATPDGQRGDFANVDMMSLANLPFASQQEVVRTLARAFATNSTVMSQPFTSLNPERRRGLLLKMPVTGAISTPEDGLIARRSVVGVSYEYEADFDSFFEAYPDGCGLHVALADSVHGVSGDFARQLVREAFGDGAAGSDGAHKHKGGYESLYTYVPPSGVDADHVAHETFTVLNSTFYIACVLSGTLSAREDAAVPLLLAALVATAFAIAIGGLISSSYLHALLSKVRVLDESKRTFISFICHEVRNPLHTIMGLGTMLVEDCEVSTFAGSMSAIDASCRLVREILDEVLEYNQLDSPKQELRTVLEPFSMFELINSLYLSFGQRCLAESLSFRLDLVGALPGHAVGDSVRLSQVCTNLLSNACKYTPAGSITFRVSCSDAEADDRLSPKPAPLESVAVQAAADSPKTDGADGTPLLAGAMPPERRRRAWVFEIEDTGRGIATEDIRSVFEPYVASRSRLKKDLGGTGLGLPLCVKIVTALGGTMGVRSQRGRGSVFWFKVVLDCGGSAPKADDEAPAFVTAAAFAPFEVRAPHRITPQTLFRRMADAEAAVACSDVAVDMSTSTTALESGSGQFRLLYCEDSAVNRKLLGRMLRKAPGVSVDYAENGLEGVAKFKSAYCGSERYDLVLMDIQMPVMNGLDATREIRAFEREAVGSGGGRTRVVACTAQIGVGAERERCLASGMDGVLVKPFSRQELMALLDV